MGRLHVMSHDHTTFANRLQAADCLSELLTPYRGGDTIVVGIARGGVVMADYIADQLGADMDATVCQKICMNKGAGPVVGAVSEDGHIVLLKEILALIRPSSMMLEQQMFLAGVWMRIQRSRYRAIRPAASLSGRTVILVDDGLTTGATLAGAIKRITREGPTQVVAAVPLASEESVGDLSEICDDLLCFSVPVDFSAIDDYYQDFPAVDDSTVTHLLKRHYDREFLEKWMPKK